MDTIRLADGTELVAEEWLHWPLFSVAEWGPTDGVNFNLFTYKVGQVVPHGTSLARRNATEADTNIVRGGTMNQDEAHITVAITYEIFGLTDADEGSPAVQVAALPEMQATNLRRLQRDLVFQLLVGAGIKKPQHGVPWAWLHQSIGAEMYVGSGASVHLATAGEITAGNQEQLGLPIYIGGYGEAFKPGNSMSYKCRIFSPFGLVAGMTQGVRVRVWLDGIRMRED